MASLIFRLLRDAEGQDVVEYALLAATIGLSAAVTFQLILSAIGGAYSAWLSNNYGLAESPLPLSGG